MSVDTGTATTAFSSTLDIGSNSLLVSADEISVGGVVSGSGGSLTLRPGTTGAQMQIGSAATAANRLDLTPAELTFIQPGFNNITFGRGDSAAAVTVNAVGLVNPTTILAGSSPVTIAGAIFSSADLSLVVGSGGIAINGAVNTATHNLTLNSGGPVAQSAPIVAAGLKLLGTASFPLTLPTNDIDILAADISGSLSLTNANGLIIGTVESTSGIATGNPGLGGTVTITASGSITVEQPIDTSAGTGGVLTATGVVFHAAPVLGAGDIVLNGLNNAPTIVHWYDSAWNYRKPITIDHTKVAGTETNFPVLINLGSDAGLQAHALANGDDILFTAADGVTKLDHEIERYSSVNGQLVAWVRVPSLSSAADTQVYVYDSNAAAANQQNVAGVWDANTMAVYHLGEAASPYADSSSNANTGAGSVSPTQTAGAIGMGQAFDGSTTGITVPNTASISVTNNFAVSVWMKLNATGQADILEKGGVQGYTFWLDGTNMWFGPQNAAPSSWAFNAANFATGTWYKLDGVVNAGISSLYINGTFVASSSASSVYANAGALKIGNGIDGRLNGTIDELRVSNTVRSAARIATEYRNQSAPSTFCGVGFETSFSGPAANDFATITEDETVNAGDLVSTLIAGQVTDVDAGALQGIAVTGLSSSTGTWQYSIERHDLEYRRRGGENYALLLRSSDRLRFVPDALTGTTSITFRAWDRTNGAAGTKVDVSTNGGARLQHGHGHCLDFGHRRQRCADRWFAQRIGQLRGKRTSCPARCRGHRGRSGLGGLRGRHADGVAGDGLQRGSIGHSPSGQRRGPDRGFGQPGFVRWRRHRIVRGRWQRHQSARDLAQCQCQPGQHAALIGNLTYSNTSDRPITTDRTVRVVLTDGDGGTSAAVTKTIVVIATNDPVTPADDAYAVDEGQTLVSDPPGADWWNTAWTAPAADLRQRCARENLVDFPVLVQLDSSRIDYSLTQNDGADLRFVDRDGTLLPHEIETWNEAGTSYVWVKVPQIDGSSGTDHIWLYYGNAAAPDAQNVAAVWNSGYVAVYHLDDTLQDSTVNLNHGTNSGSLEHRDAWPTGNGLTVWTTASTWDRPRPLTTCLRVGERFPRGSGPQAGVKVVMVGFSTRPSTTSPTAGGGSNSTVRTNHCGSSKAIRVPLAGRGTHPAAQPNSARGDTSSWSITTVLSPTIRSFTSTAACKRWPKRLHRAASPTRMPRQVCGWAIWPDTTRTFLGNMDEVRLHASCVPPTGRLPNTPL